MSSDLRSLNDLKSHGIKYGTALMVPDAAKGQVIPANVSLSERIWQEFEPGYRGYAVDVGASDGISVNSTWYLEKARRWMVLCVEPNPVFTPILKHERIWSEVVACGQSPHDEAEFFANATTNPEEGSSLSPALKRSARTGELLQYQRLKVRVETLDRLLAKWQFPRLDLLCVDTEGTELDVLKGLDIAKWKPRVIVTECWHDTSDIDPYLAGFGYEKADRQVDNDIHVLRTT